MFRKQHNVNYFAVMRSPGCMDMLGILSPQRKNLSRRSVLHATIGDV